MSPPCGLWTKSFKIGTKQSHICADLAGTVSPGWRVAFFIPTQGGDMGERRRG
jgi:hypothetical protein